MNFDDYQSFTKETGVYPQIGTGSVGALTYCALGLGEAGEVQGKVKKIIRDTDGLISDQQKSDIAAELGDVLWYLARTADEIGFSLSEIAQSNMEKLLSRRDRGVLGGSGDNR